VRRLPVRERRLPVRERRLPARMKLKKIKKKKKNLVSLFKTCRNAYQYTFASPLLKENACF
jgi:hypothetical protein